MLLVATERIVVLELEVRLIDPPEIVGSFVVLEDLFAVELVHSGHPSSEKIRLQSSSPSTSRSTSSGVL